MIRSEFLKEKVSTPSNSLKLGMYNLSDPISGKNPEAQRSQKWKIPPKKQSVKSPEPVGLEQIIE